MLARTRNSLLQISYKIDILKSFANSAGKHLCWSLFNKVAEPAKSATLTKGDANTGVFL